VIGFDDIALLDYLPLRLTSVRMPKAQMGRLAAEVLIRHIESREALPPQKVYLEAELVVRDSTRAVAPAAAPRRPARIRVSAAAADDAAEARAGSTAGAAAR
jgi:hypothetical protein